ncbi:hypothetical protein U9M48_020569 [Paspalum notatum var. saurae]|uniref:SIAH-type domain-containing protein n=1 Tax=Paspalum notatum var. saurae TaxID=547442 RepID=A0AAQ3WSU1_PASNO
MPATALSLNSAGLGEGLASCNCNQRQPKLPSFEMGGVLGRHYRSAFPRRLGVMSEYQGSKRGLVPEDGERSHCAKKPRSEQAMAPGPGGVITQDGEASHGSSDGEGEGVLAAAEAMEEPRIKITIGVSLLHCQACLLPLKPPTFKVISVEILGCEAGHVVCCTCRGKHGQACGRAASYAACRDLDAFLLDAKVPCQNEEFGCESEVVYYQATEHHATCKWAPCFCPNPGCGFFSSPARLVEHFRDQHHWWPVTAVSYGRPFKLPVPAPPQGCHVLVGKEDRSVFFVSSAALGAAAAAVSLVCVRAAGPLAPRFKCALSVSVELPSNKGELVLTMSEVRSSDLSGGFPPPDQSVFLAVPSVLLHDAPGGAPDLMVCIDKADACRSTGELHKCEALGSRSVDGDWQCGHGDAIPQGCK